MCAEIKKINEREKLLSYLLNKKSEKLWEYPKTVLTEMCL